MRQTLIPRGLVLLLALLFAVAPKTGARAETFVGSNVDSRILVGINANAAGIQGWMPDGWASISFPTGPLKGANLILAMIDSRVELDPDGIPLTPPSRRAVAVVGLAKQTDGDAVRMFVLRIYTTAPERDPYGVAQKAAIAREYALTGPADGARESSDFWRVAPESGGRIALTLNHASGNRGWAPGELFPYSAANPEFSRIYRYDQLVDLVQSDALGKPLTGEFKLHVSVLELEDIFDGSEQVVTVIDVPVYVGKIYLP